MCDHFKQNQKFEKMLPHARQWPLGRMPAMAPFVRVTRTADSERGMEGPGHGSRYFREVHSQLPSPLGGGGVRGLFISVGHFQLKNVTRSVFKNTLNRIFKNSETSNQACSDIAVGVYIPTTAKKHKKITITKTKTRGIPQGVPDWGKKLEKA